MNPYQVVHDFEAALCEYTGAKHAVSCTSCTMAILLVCSWHLKHRNKTLEQRRLDGIDFWFDGVEIPKRTYVSVPMSIIHAGGRVRFRDEDWLGEYQLKPYSIWDSARRFTSGMFRPGQAQCLSFHWSKILGLGQGGAILHDDSEADEWLRRARFDGRSEGLSPDVDDIQFPAWHAYMTPETAAQGLVRLALLPRHNADLPNDDYPDLSEMAIFR